MRLIRIAALMAVSIVAAFGCSRSEFVEVAGTVAWKGQPVETGEIVFKPENKALAPAAGRIRGGAYKLVCRPGKARVEIQAVRKTGKRDPREGFEITELFIPAKYNSQSTLAAEVTAEGDNHFDFKLTD
jgi:hypothetical protein